MKPAVTAIGTLLVGALAISGAALVLHSAPVTPPTLVATPSTAPGSLPPGVTKAVSLNLSTYGDSSAIKWRRGNGGQGPHPDWVSYGPTTVLQVPAHALVTVTITQYDTGDRIPNPFLSEVHGTVGGTAQLTMADGKTSTVTSIDQAHVGHTFTVRSFPSSAQDTLFVSVPVPAVSSNAPALANGFPKPNVMTFSFITKGKGTYAWNCEFPCGSNYASFGGPMATYGYMSGTLKVV